MSDKAKLYPNLKSGSHEGNRGKEGRKKGIRPFKKVIEEILSHESVDLEDEETREKYRLSGQQALVMMLFKKAVKENDISAAREIMDRLEGKPTQKTVSVEIDKTNDKDAREFADSLGLNLSGESPQSGDPSQESLKDGDESE